MSPEPAGRSSEVALSVADSAVMDERLAWRHTYSIVELRCTPKPSSQGSHCLQCWWWVESE